MRGVASIRTETHLRRFLHGIRLFCNAHSPPKALSPQKHYLPKTFFSPKNTLQSSKAPYCRWQYGPSIALFRYAQYGLLSPYFATLNTGFCRPISLRSIRALATLLPLAGQCAPPLRLCARRSAACAHTPTQPARIAVGNTGQSNTIHPIHIKMII